MTANDPKKFNDMKTSNKKGSQRYQSAPSIQTPKLPPSEEQIRQRAHEIFAARGGADGMALDDWLQAEQELKEKLEG